MLPTREISLRSHPQSGGMLPPFYPMEVWVRMVLMTEGLAGGRVAAGRHAKAKTEGTVLLRAEQSTNLEKFKSPSVPLLKRGISPD